MAVDHSLLEAQQIGRRHPDGVQWLLQDVSLQLDRGQRVALLGSSGAGKTLLLRALARLDRVDTGSVLYCNRPIVRAAIPHFRSQVVYLHQRVVLGEGRVETILRRPFDFAVHRAKHYQRERIVDWLKQLGRGEGFLVQHGQDLSGGEGQIVVLLRALQLDPQVLLLDEPTAALDTATTAAVEQLLLDWVDEPGHDRAFIWVSHDEAQTPRIADRIIRMDAGHLTASE